MDLVGNVVTMELIKTVGVDVTLFLLAVSQHERHVLVVTALVCAFDTRQLPTEPMIQAEQRVHSSLQLLEIEPLAGSDAFLKVFMAVRFACTPLSPERFDVVSILDVVSTLIDCLPDCSVGGKYHLLCRGPLVAERTECTSALVLPGHSRSTSLRIKLLLSGERMDLYERRRPFRGRGGARRGCGRLATVVSHDCDRVKGRDRRNCQSRPVCQITSGMINEWLIC